VEGFMSVAFQLSGEGGVEVRPLIGGDGLAAFGAGGGAAAFVDVDGDAGTGGGDGGFSVAADGEGFAFGGWAECGVASTGAADSVVAWAVGVDAGEKGGDGGAVDAGVGVGVETGEDGGGDDEHGVVVDSPVVGGGAAHGLPVVAGDAEEIEVGHGGGSPVSSPLARGAGDYNSERGLGLGGRGYFHFQNFRIRDSARPPRKLRRMMPPMNRD
jgi:hypothetical protein